MAVAKYESYDDTPDSYMNPYGASWYAQTFTVGNTGANENFNLTSIKLFAHRYGTPGTITVAIKATTAGLPSGEDISTGTFDGDTLGDSVAEWFEVTMSSVELSADTKYALIVKCLAGDWNATINWQIVYGGGTYTGGNEQATDDSGANWTEYDGYDFNFEVWGEGIVAGQFMQPTKYW